MPPKEEIIYPIFLECNKFVEDAFWENVFNELAHGKTPYGTYINKDFLCCGYKGKEFSYKIERKDPKVLYDDVYELLGHKLGILSQKEKVKKRLDFHELEKTIKESRQDWGNIRKKNVKDVLYEKFVLEMKNKHSLSVKETKNLLSVILIGIMFKTITAKDITYEEDKITKINGIDFVEGQLVLSRSLYSSSSQKTSQTPVVFGSTQKRMADNWDKYVKTMRKKS